MQRLAISIEKQILVRCGDVSTNPGPTQSSLSCYVQNVRSLKAVRAVESSFESKISLLQDIVYGQDLDIICLSETWLNGSVSDQEILPVSYDIYRSDRLGRSGGGTLTAIKTLLSSSQVPIPSEFSSLEMVVVEIGSLRKMIVVFQSSTAIDHRVTLILCQDFLVFYNHQRLTITTQSWQQEILISQIFSGWKVRVSRTRLLVRKLVLEAFLWIIIYSSQWSTPPEAITSQTQ